MKANCSSSSNFILWGTLSARNAFFKTKTAQHRYTITVPHSLFQLYKTQRTGKMIRNYTGWTKQRHCTYTCIGDSIYIVHHILFTMQQHGSTSHRFKRKDHIERFEEREKNVGKMIDEKSRMKPNCPFSSNSILQGTLSARYAFVLFLTKTAQHRYTQSLLSHQCSNNQNKGAQLKDTWQDGKVKTLPGKGDGSVGGFGSLQKLLSFQQYK